jgi:hypothetical protein
MPPLLGCVVPESHKYELQSRPDVLLGGLQKAVAAQGVGQAARAGDRHGRRRGEGGDCRPGIEGRDGGGRALIEVGSSRGAGGGEDERCVESR